VHEAANRLYGCSAGKGVTMGKGLGTRCNKQRFFRQRLLMKQVRVEGQGAAKKQLPEYPKFKCKQARPEDKTKQIQVRHDTSESSGGSTLPGIQKILYQGGNFTSRELRKKKNRSGAPSERAIARGVKKQITGK